MEIEEDKRGPFGSDRSPDDELHQDRISGRHYSYWYYMYLRRSNHNQAFENVVKFGVLPLAVIGLIAGTILVRQLPSNQIFNNATMNFPSIEPISKSMKDGFLCHASSDEYHCSGLNLANGPQPLLRELANAFQQQLKVTTLSLSNTIFKNGRLEEGWLPIEEGVHCEFSKLKIDGEELNGIGENSFNNLHKLTSITIANSAITYLIKDGFKGLPVLNDLELRGNKQLSQVEWGLILELRGLTTLQLNGIELTEEEKAVQFFQNLTGDQPVSSIQILDLQDNIMGTFRKAYVDNFPGAHSIYLINNQIEDFQPAAFDVYRDVDMLTQIYLSSNPYDSYPENVFRDIVKNPNIVLNVQGNGLTCDCQVAWLQTFIISKNRTDLYRMKCTNPQENRGLYFVEVDLDNCENSTTPEPSATPEPTTSITPTSKTSSTTQEPTSPTSPPPTQESTTSDPTTSQPPTDGVAIILEERDCPPSTCGALSMNKTGQTTYDYAFTENPDENSIEIVVNSADKPVMLAMRTQKDRDMTCFGRKDKQGAMQKMTVANIAKNTDYLFCFFSESDEENGLIPLEKCAPYTTKAAFEDEAWLTNSEKTTSIVLIVCGVVTALLTGGMIAYLIVRKKPTLLKGSQRVEIVKSRNGETVLVMPEHRNERQTSPYAIYETISGYISSESQCPRGPPPLPPYPPYLRRGTTSRSSRSSEHDYLEPRFLRKTDRTPDLLLEYEWYTSQQRASSGFKPNQTLRPPNTYAQLSEIN